MNKILVEVYLPVANKSFDVLLPYIIKVSEATVMLKKLFEELESDYYTASSDALLCSANDGNPLNREVLVCELGIKNGSKLILI